jgi:hypothetical protein
VIEGGRNVRVGVAPEDDEADAVGGAAAYEVLDHRLGRLQAVRHEVGLLHRSGEIERDHDVDALELEIVVAAGGLGPRQADAEQHHGEEPQHHR